MAGAVDLSGLKQRAQQKTSAAGPEGQATSAPPGTTEVTEANFEQEVLLRSDEVPVVVLLWSPRSDACVELLETLTGLAAEDDGKWSLATVNVDATPRVAQIFGVEAVPTVVALAAGQPLSSFQGLQPPDQLRRWVESLISATAGKLRGSSDSDQAAEVDSGCPAARATTVGTASTPNIWATLGVASTLTVASDHLPSSSAAKPVSVSSSSTHASLRGDHNKTTTGTSSDRSSTSCSKLASVTSVAPGGADVACPSRPVAIVFCWTRCLRRDKSAAPAIAGPIEDRGRVTSSSLSCASVTDPPGGGDAQSG